MDAESVIDFPVPVDVSLIAAIDRLTGEVVKLNTAIERLEQRFAAKAWWTGGKRG